MTAEERALLIALAAAVEGIAATVRCSLSPPPSGGVYPHMLDVLRTKREDLVRMAQAEKEALSP